MVVFSTDGWIFDKNGWKIVGLNISYYFKILKFNLILSYKNKSLTKIFF